MRLRHAAALSLLALAAAVVPLPAGSAAAAVPLAAGSATAPAPASAPVPDCGNVTAHDFPMRVRLGGPPTYRAGGGAQPWYLDLTNTTDHACRNVHPVLVITDTGRHLKAAHIALRLADRHGALQAVPLQTSDEDEIIGVFGKDTTGFTVPARDTVTLDASLAFADGSPAGRVAVSASAVQRKGADGEWIGQSTPYRLRVVGGSEEGEGDGSGSDGSGTGSTTGGATPGSGTISGWPSTERPSGAESAAETEAEPARGTQTEPARRTKTEPGTEATRGSDPEADPSRGPTSAPVSASAPASPPASPSASTSTSARASSSGGASSSPSASAPALSHPAIPHPAIPQLAATGAAGVILRTALSVALIAAGAGIVVLVERRRTRRP